MSYCVYLVECPRGLYCGITTNPERRFRQHSGELKGGAKSIKALGGCKEMRVIHEGLSKSDAMKLEHETVKQQSRAKKLHMFNERKIL